MLLGDIYLLDTHVVLKDVDGSTVELTAHDAWKVHQWILRNKISLYEAIRREDAHTQRTRAVREEANNAEQSTE